MQTQLSIQLHNRKIFHHFLSKFTNEQLNCIPEGFNNNIIWNVAHTLVTHQSLVYRLSGLSMHIPEEWVALFAKGTKPTREITPNEVKEIDQAMFSTYELLVSDMESGVFKEFNPYTTSTTMQINNVETAQTFALFHDGLHTGSVLALAKLV